jgi:predicted NUDIX family NTP pyrophosphohydrolase
MYNSTNCPHEPRVDVASWFGLRVLKIKVVKGWSHLHSRYASVQSNNDPGVQTTILAEREGPMFSWTTNL